jgi:AraC family transcriptional regulator, regulatory protein of adaptative response / DNA-3-methyladenine glycosylase II
MQAQELSTSADACYAVMKARDARFDGCFFTGVTSTGIYCRPVCSVKAPKRENCRFFGHAAQAESAGFRPCLRCRPELAPHSVVWSIQDASYILAHQAARLLDEPQSWPDPPGTPSVEKLALKLGISGRHLRRIFEAQFGVSPLQYLQTRRLHTAKQLLADTQLPVTQIALMSGFASVRRFNAAFAAHYKLNPTQLRRAAPKAGSEQGITVRLGYRPPYDVQTMLAFMETRRIKTIEVITIESIAAGAHKYCATRTFGIEVAGKKHTGWLQMRFDEARSQLVLTVSDSLRDVLPLVIRRVRAAFDLDADPKAINAVLHGDFPTGDGLRVPGALDGFELAVRAVLGQQITVAAARTLAQRLVNEFGEPIATPWPELTRLFPSPAALAAATSDALGQLGIVRQRQAAIVGLAKAVAGGLQLHGGADVQATVEALKALPGIGDWTAQYIAMRALRWPDAFPAADVALHKILGVQGLKNPARLAEAASTAWKPWRSYAVIRTWSGAWRGPDNSSGTAVAINSGAASARRICGTALNDA